MGRPRQPLLSRDRIVEVALDLVDAEGLDVVSTRRLASELGVSGPALYNHFATKDELIDAVVDSVLGEVDIAVLRTVCEGVGHGGDWNHGHDGGHATAEDGDAVRATAEATTWDDGLRAWARSYRAVLGAHPNVVPALAAGPGRRPNALRMADAVFGALICSGWPRAQATRVGVLMRYFVTGSALGSFAGGFPDDAALYAGEYPHLGQAHLLADAQREINENAFEAGLEALLFGLNARYERVRLG